MKKLLNTNVIDADQQFDKLIGLNKLQKLSKNSSNYTTLPVMKINKDKRSKSVLNQQKNVINYVKHTNQYQLEEVIKKKESLNLFSHPIIQNLPKIHIEPSEQTYRTNIESTFPINKIEIRKMPQEVHD